MDYLSDPVVNENIRRGRPKNHNVDKLCTRMWFSLLTKRVTAEPSKEVWTIWTITEGRLGSRQTLKRYRNGSRVPKKYGISNPIEIANEIFPGTNAIWLSPMWRVLQRKPIDEESVIRGITSLGGVISFVLLKGTIRDFPSFRDPQNGLLNLFRFLSESPDFKTLQAIILLLGWANHIQNHYFWNRICELYRFMIPAFLERDNIPCHEDFLDAVDDIARHREFSSVNVRVETFKSWRDEIPRYHKLVSENEKINQEQWGWLKTSYTGSGLDFDEPVREVSIRPHVHGLARSFINWCLS